MANITDTAMLAVHRQSKWEGRKYDRSVSTELCNAKGATTDSARVNKLIVPKEFILPVSRAFSRCYQYHREMTLPWLDSGERVLPSELYFDYTSRMSEFKQEITDEVNRMVARYPDVLAAAPFRLGQMYKASDFPAPETLPKLFSVSTLFLPLPVEDVRVQGVSDEELQRINEQKEAEIQRALQDTVHDLYGRVHAVVSKMSEGLGRYKRDDVTGKVENTFRDSLVENVRDLVELLPRMNFTRNEQLAGMVDIMKETVCRFDAEQLRENEQLRDSVREGADLIAKTMEIYMGAQS